MENRFKILSIDGGGIRGVFPAMFLALFESRLREQGKANWQVYQNFDLICGTSTGGLMAIALSLGIPAKNIYDMYLEKAKDIFGQKKSGWKQIFQSAHERENLETITRQFFKQHFDNKNDPRLIDCKVPTMIPIYDLIKGEASVLKSKYHERFIRDYHIPCYQAAMATSAAPTYFDPYSNNYTDLNGIEKTFNNKVDGGVWANNPTLNAIIEVQKAFDKKLEDLSILSLGTGHQKFSEGGIRRNGKPRRKYGIWYWMKADKKKRLIDLFMQGQSQQTQNLISLLQKGIDKSEADNFTYYRIDTQLDETSNIGMDETDKGKLEMLAEKANIEFQHQGNRIISEFS